ncbi:recombinase family protein [Rhodovulum sulfidophilum]|uniref:recombinase family protein n=1 Tax=Rhodovulum sulfidophilum TaxID=35806 RepID=UPI001F3C1ABB|nr:recombinase family protein [Rhodovulum sulfidophilum]MCE8455905.1 recombinase family protein [Rhodovulum sulfidophilum]
MPTPRRAAIYARYSTGLQRDASIEDQIRVGRTLADRQGYEVVKVYFDHAASDASLMRPGIRSLLQDAREARTFDIVLAHALDRLSQNQADIASIYQQLQFVRILIETVSEGLIEEMHIGLKGTMNALFLKDLAKKTREGLRGRAIAGKSAGGLTFGTARSGPSTRPASGSGAIARFIRRKRRGRAHSARLCPRARKRVDLECKVLDTLEHHLMDPGLAEAFCKEYTAERNRLQDAALPRSRQPGKRTGRA